MEEKFIAPCNLYYDIFTDKKTKGYNYQFLSPFEFKNILIKNAIKSYGESNILNAGRGNPNFFSTMPRYAFALLTKIALKISEEFSRDEDLGFIPEVKGIGKTFDKMLFKTRKHPEGKFLKQACDNMCRLSGMKKDEFTHNIVISVLGCSYPEPSRIQTFLEPVLSEYFNKNVYRSKKSLKGKVKIMPTEGCAAAILYLLNSLKYNGLLIPGDKIGILTPIYSPYLEIPALKNYNLEQICINADENNNWEIPQIEINKIGDPQMKALFLVNPTNPTGMSLSSDTVRKITTAIRKNNPNIIIIEDNVYAPYVEEFNDFFNVLPRNTIGIFSFSKYFGATGWRLGTIIMHNNNIIDNLLLNPKMRKDTKILEEINNRYKMIDINPEKIKFIDRVLADSRQVSEAHVAGLSTPQQMIISLFAVYELLDKQKYHKTLTNMLYTRINNLVSPLEYEVEESKINTNYYVVINITKVANNLLGGIDFGNYLQKHRDPLEFLINLSKKYGTVLLPAVSFAGPWWGVRVSLANLDNDDYKVIGENLRSLIDEYYEDFKKWEKREHRKSEKIAEKY